MILGYDAKRLFHNTSGLGNYSRTLLQDLRQNYPENKYHLFTPSLSKQPWTNAFLNEPFRVHKPEVKIWWWRSWSLPGSFPAGLQLYHGLSHELPFTIHRSGVRSIVTIHDLIYRHFPQDFPKPDRIVYEQKIRYALQRAHHVVAISNHTLNDIQSHYHLSPDRISVIYQAVHPLFRQMPPQKSLDATKKRFGLPENYLLYVGAISHRKNLLLVLQALHADRRLDVPLVVIGKGKHYEQKCRQYVEANGLGKQVIWLGHVAPDQIPSLVKGASVVIYPSLYEGFGLPVLESIMLDVPVITTSESSLPEAGGQLAHYIRGRDPAELAERLHVVLGNQKVTDSLARKEHLSRFDPVSISRQWQDLYRKVIDD